MTRQRFSKQAMLDHINYRIGQLEMDHGFEQGWGWARVEGKDTEVVVAFGRYEELIDLRDDIALGV